MVMAAAQPPAGVVVKHILEAELAEQATLPISFK